MKIVVTGAGALLGQGIIRSLKGSSLKNLEIIAVDPGALSAGLYWVDKRYLIPLASDVTYIEQIELLLKKTGADLLIPGTDVELHLLAKNRERLESITGAKILVSSPEVVEIADDKFQTAQFFSNHGFSPPVTGLGGDENRVVEQAGFPLIVKPRRGARSVGLHLVNDRDQLKSAIASVEDPVIQECVGDETCEYTAGTLVFGGTCRASIVMRRDLRDGNTYRAFVDSSPELRRQVEEFAVSLGAFGPANFQFRVEKDLARVFEINARFSGTTPLRMHAGFNEVEMCVRYLLEGVPVVQPELRQVTVLRHWDDTVLDSSTVAPEKVR